MNHGLMAIFVKMRQNAHFETSYSLLKTFILIKQRDTNKSTFKKAKVYERINLLKFQFIKFYNC